MRIPPAYLYEFPDGFQCEHYSTMILRRVRGWLRRCFAQWRNPKPLAIPVIFGEPVLFPMLLLLAVIWLLPHTPYPKRIHSSVSERYRQLPSVKVDFHPQRTLNMRYPPNKTALYVEPRDSITFITPLLLHMMQVVPPEWRFVFLGTEKTTAIARSSGAAARYEQLGKLRVGSLAEKWARSWGTGWEDLGVDEMNSRLLTNMSFYDEELSGTEHLFVFHSDGILCANSEVDLNDWLHYDWVGAPWNNGAKFGGNGGLSLRRVSKVREVLAFQKRIDDTTQEDQWLSSRLGLLPGANMAPSEIEKEFAVEDVWYEWPMGYHVNPGGFSQEVWEPKQRRKDIYNYCPEIKIILDMRLERERCPEPEPESEPVAVPGLAGDQQSPAPKTQEDYDAEINGQPVNLRASEILKEHLKSLDVAEGNLRGTFNKDNGEGKSMSEVEEASEVPELTVELAKPEQTSNSMVGEGSEIPNPEVNSGSSPISSSISSSPSLE